MVRSLSPVHPIVDGWFVKPLANPGTRGRPGPGLTCSVPPNPGTGSPQVDPQERRVGPRAPQRNRAWSDFCTWDLLLAPPASPTASPATPPAPLPVGRPPRSPPPWSAAGTRCDERGGSSAPGPAAHALPPCAPSCSLRLVSGRLAL